MAATVYSLVLVSLLASSGLAWENLPSIPAGRRVEYYLQHDDGGYKYGYDTGAGQSAQVDANPVNEVQGKYSYINKDGQQVSLQYSAGEGGFVPQLDGIPAPGIGGGAGPGSRAGPAAPSGSGLYPSGAPSGEADGQVDADYDANADASYSFNIDTDSYKRTESSDPRGNIRGQYSYNSPVGGSHGLSYVAGEGTGFVVTGSTDGIGAGAGPGAPGSTGFPGAAGSYAGPAAPATPYSGPAANTQGGLNPDGSYSFSFSAPDQTREEAADAQNNVRGSYSFKAKDDGQTRRVDYSAGASTGFVASGAHLPVAPSAGSPVAPGAPGSPASAYSAPGLPSATPYSGPAANTQGGLNPDGSYSFSFSAPDQTREEAADAQNNVRGSYSFKAKDDGQTRRVDYSAGASTGFVASGAHLPVAPSAGSPGSPGAPGAPGSPTSAYSAPGLPSAPATPYSGRAANTQGGLNPDGSYSFSFSAPDQTREEAADAQNNVRGSYSFKAKDDGQTRRVDYSAGAATGFVASGAHLPVAPSAGAPGALGGPGSAGPLGGLGAPTFYSASSAPAAPVSPYSGPVSNTQGTSNPDGSYSFSYSTDEQSRQESADAQNNIRGSFSFKAKDDGQTRRVDYSAGAATGFVASGAHLPVAPSAGAPGAPGSGLGLSGIGAAGPYAGPGAPRSPGSPAGSSSGPGVDGSYSFSYNTGDQSRDEAGDPKGNVRGSFSFVAKDDGQTRRVDYEAGAERGFIAKGAHLPVSPSGDPAGGAPGAGAPVVGAGPISAYLGPSGSGAPGSGSDDGQDNGDASYSYNYQTDTSSKTESSDSQGNVQGEFSFIGGDGVSRKLSYTSRGKDGFIASGGHLPQAPAPGAGGATPGGAGGVPAGSGLAGSRAGGAVFPQPGLPAPSSGHVKSVDIRGLGFVLNKYLPLQRKTGYIFDSNA